MSYSYNMLVYYYMFPLHKDLKQFHLYMTIFLLDLILSYNLIECSIYNQKMHPIVLILVVEQ